MFVRVLALQVPVGVKTEVVQVEVITEVLAQVVVFIMEIVILALCMMEMDQ